MLSEGKEIFCLAMIDPNIPSITDAWLAAHPNSKATRKTAGENGSRWMADPKVKQRIDQLRAPAVAEGRYTLLKAIRGQERAVELADDTGAAGAMSGAYREIAKLSDLYPKEGPGVVIDNRTQTVNITRVELARRMAHIIEAGVIEGSNGDA